MSEYGNLSKNLKNLLHLREIQWLRVQVEVYQAINIHK